MSCDEADTIFEYARKADYFLIVEKIVILNEKKK